MISNIITRLRVNIIIKYSTIGLYNILKRIKNRESVVITDSEHFLGNTQRKYCEHGLIYELLRNHDPLNIKLSDDNKFIVVYNHPSNTRYYVVVVIFIRNPDEIRLVTTFPTRLSKGGKYL